MTNEYDKDIGETSKLDRRSVAVIDSKSLYSIGVEYFEHNYTTIADEK
jgi:hypothetical protein